MPRKQAHPASPDSLAISSFETEFERLTSIVDRLEAGNVPLTEMLKLYEEGMGLTANLKLVLEQAELKVEKLSAIHEESNFAASSNAGVTYTDDDAPEDSDDDALLF